MSEWEPESYEDRLLQTYHDNVGGRIYTEVATPWSRGYKSWPDGYRNRYIDAIRLLEPYHVEEIVPFANHGAEVLHIVEDASVELIEIKARLNRPVIGQVLAGDDLFQAEYAPAEVRRVALCESADPALEWVCNQRNITVELEEPTE